MIFRILFNCGFQLVNRRMSWVFNLIHMILVMHKCHITYSHNAKPLTYVLWAVRRRCKPLSAAISFKDRNKGIRAIIHLINCTCTESNISHVPRTKILLRDVKRIYIILIYTLWCWISVASFDFIRTNTSSKYHKQMRTQPTKKPS